MAGKAIWKGIIHFGSVDAAVKLHTAVKEERIQFHLLHKRDNMRLSQQMFCAFEKTPVPAGEQVRGFEVEEGKYVLIDPEELEEADPQASRMIEVHEFVKARQIDPVFFSRSYYLEPDMPAKTYSVLTQAMEELNVEGICTWTMRKRSYLGALAAAGRILCLHTLRYADEVISTTSLDLPQIPLTEKELQIGSDLINQMTGSFEPQKFENEHEKKLQALIDKKARGERIVILRPRRPKPTAPDKLLQTLEASLKKVA